MKTIELTPVEYITNFKKIAHFWFTAHVVHGMVFIEANINNLKSLGY